MNLNINNETNTLVSVVLGIANDMGAKPSIENCIDPKTRESIINNSYPEEIKCINQIETFAKILKKYNVKVFRPENIKNLNQIFSRDIAFVIENKVFVPEIIKERNDEKNGIFHLLKKIKKENKIFLPKNIKIEGGDIILYNDYIFVGYTNDLEFNKFKVARTNSMGYEFIKKSFPNKKVYGFELTKNDYSAYSNVLHLDCTMQPIGENQLIIYEKGFKNKKDITFLNELFGGENIIKINKSELFDLYSNIFSININTIVSNKSFERLNSTLESNGYKVEKIDYGEISKFGGLFRCSTLPIERK